MKNILSLLDKNLYTDYNLVFASTSGTPIEGATISRLFNKLISSNDLPRVVFHSIRHTSTTYKLMLSGSNIKGVQGDTGRAHASMVTEQYAHILDDNRRMNAERFQQQFYSIPISEEPAVQPDPFQQLDTGKKQAFLVKLLTNPRRWHDDKAIGTGHVTQRGVKNPLKNMLLQKAEGIPQKVSFKKYSAGFSYIKFLEFRFYRPFFYDDNKSINCCCFFAKSMI